MIALAAYLRDHAGVDPYLCMWRVGGLRLGRRGADYECGEA